MRQTQETPYVGPRPFETGETLYGRDWEVEELRDRLIAKRIVLLHSPSGAGKTSLIQAGLIPALQEEQIQILPIVRVNAEPPSELVEAGCLLNRYVLSTLSYLEKDRARDDRQKSADLAEMQLAEYLDQRRAEAAGKDSQQESTVKVLVFDQFEEILTVDPTDVEAKKEFFAQLGVALRDPSLYALFAMRGDYVASLDLYLRPVPYLLSTRFRIERLSVEAARLAIQEPAGAWDVDFTDGAANKLIDDLRQVRVQRLDGRMQKPLGPYVEPVQLQVVCQLLWQSPRSNPAKIAEADVKSFGSVDNALGAYYAGEVARVAGETEIPERTIRDWFDSQLITEQGFRGQIMQGVDQSGGLKNDAIRRLIDAYLVREEKRRGVTWFELAHDRLIEPVRQDNVDWRKKNLQEWQRQALRWSRQGQPATLLLADKEVKEAERWVGRHPHEKLTEDEHSFLDASRKAASLEAARRQRRLFLGGVALLILFAGLTAWALGSARQARIAENEALLHRVLAEVASTRAIREKETAEAEGKSAIDARATLAANLEAILTAQVPTATGTPTASPTPTATPRGSPGPGPTPTSTSTPTITPTPTPDQTATAAVEALQTQLAQVQATQTVVAVLQTSFGHKVGWHLGNARPMGAGDWSVIGAVPPSSVVFLSGEAIGGDDIRRILEISPDAHIFMRAHFPPSDKEEDFRLYLKGVKALIAPGNWEFIPEERRHLQIFNEPNMPHTTPLDHPDDQWEGFGPSLEGMERLNRWFVTAYDELKAVNPTWKIGFPPLTAGNRDVYIRTDPEDVPYYMHGPEAAKENPSPEEIQAAIESGPCYEALMRADEYLVHVYVLNDAEHQMFELWAGLRFVQYAKFFPKPMDIWITELGIGGDESNWVRWFQLLDNYPEVKGTGIWILGHIIRSDGDSTVQALREYVNSLPVRPIVDFSANPTSGPVPLAVHFTDQSRGSIVAWRWDFGDGNTGIAQNPAHTYSTPGDYSVMLTVGGPGGSSTLTEVGLISVGAATPSPAPTIKPTPTPTLNQAATATVEAKQTQLAQVQATQTAVAGPPGRIVFTSNRLSDADVYLIKADGSGVERLTFNVAFDPSYSPGADKIVCATKRNDRAWLLLLGPEGKEEPIGGKDWDNWDPAFSHGGKRVAFVSSRHGGWDIYSMNVDGSDVKRLTSHPAEDWGASWSPDDQRIAFVSERDGHADIWVMDADGGNLVRLTFNRAQDVYPDWSPDGRQIAFGSDRDGNVEIYAIDVDGRNLRNLTNSPFDENYPSWSPDGKWLAFSRFTDNNDIFVMSLDGDQLFQLTKDPAMDMAPIWLP